MTMERPSEFGGPSAIRVESPGTVDHSEADTEGIKESFSRFSAKINELDEQLGRFANDSLRLDQIIGLLSAIKKTREMLRRTHEVFFRNATALLPELFELAYENCTSDSRDSNSEHFFMHPQYFRDPSPPFGALPVVLEQLAHSLDSLHMRIERFKEFTDEGILLRFLLLTLKNDLLYRASCARAYSGRLNTPPIQHYIHQFAGELEGEFEKVSTAIREFTAVGVSVICHTQRRSSQNLANILTVATLFSGVTISALQISTGIEGSPATSLWCVSLACSASVAAHSIGALMWKELRPISRGKMKSILKIIDFTEAVQGPLFGCSIFYFMWGLFLFSLEKSDVALFVILFNCGSTTMALPIALFVAYSPYLRSHSNERDFTKYSAEPVYPDVSEFYFRQSGVAGVLSKSLCSLGFHRGTPQGGAENMGEKGTTFEEFPTRRASGEMLRSKLRSNVKNVSMLNSTVAAFLSAGNQHKRNHPKALLSPRGRLHINANVPSVPVTQLSIPPESRQTIEFSRYGAIHDIAYSEDGKWLAVAYAKERTHQSWTAVLDSESLDVVADTWHEGTVIAERLVWSPSGTKLIIKFDHRFDVWDLTAKNLNSIERQHYVNDVKWCGDDTFLVAEHNCVFKMNPGSRLLATYVFGRMDVRSIGVEKNTNYLILITCAVQSGPKRLTPASCRSEKRIIIYDTDKQETVYEVPVLEDICGVQPITGTLDFLVTHKDKKKFQLWSLDAGLKGTQIIPRLKKRAVTPHTNPGDYIGTTCIGGNNNEFVLSVTSTGAIDFWHRESGSPLQRFEARILRCGGCLSWRRSNSGIATFATAGGSNLHVWQGEEQVLTETPTGSDFIQVSYMDATDSGSVSPREVEQVEPSRGTSLDPDTANR